MRAKYKFRQLRRRLNHEVKSRGWLIGRRCGFPFFRRFRRLPPEVKEAIRRLYFPVLLDSVFGATNLFNPPPLLSRLAQGASTEEGVMDEGTLPVPGQ